MFFLNRNERGWRVAFPDWQLPERNVRETNVYPHSLRALARPSTPIICVISPWNFLGGHTLRCAQVRSAAVNSKSLCRKASEYLFRALFAKFIFSDKTAVSGFLRVFMKQNTFTIQKMADDLGINVKFLYLLSNRTQEFYKIYRIPKKNGKFRIIDAPCAILKRIQEYILRFVLPDKISLGGTRCTKALQSLRRQDPEADVTRNEITSLMSAATAFEPGTSIKDNAENHCGRPVVIALDVKDFFPSLKYSRVLALFRRYTETENAAVMLAKLCTLYGHLPQGAVTSPHISNLLLHDLDFTLKLYALDHNLEFTRYADDLTFSGNPDNGEISGLIQICRQELRKSGLRLNNDKIRIMRKGMRQEVTGIVVNSKMNAPREDRRRLRQQMYYLNKHWEHEWRKLDEHSLNVLLGKANFIWDLNRENPEIAEYRRQLLEIKRSFQREAKKAICSAPQDSAEQAN